MALDLQKQDELDAQTEKDHHEQLTVDNTFDDMLSVEQETAQQKIVSEIVNDKNLELKTEITNVTEITLLKVFEDFIDKNHLTQSAKTLNGFLGHFFRFNVSKKRKSRDELIRMVEALSKSADSTTNNSKINLIS